MGPTEPHSILTGPHTTKPHTAQPHTLYPPLQLLLPHCRMASAADWAAVSVMTLLPFALFGVK